MPIGLLSRVWNDHAGSDVPGTESRLPGGDHRAQHLPVGAVEVVRLADHHMAVPDSGGARRSPVDPVHLGTSGA